MRASPLYLAPQVSRQTSRWYAAVSVVAFLSIATPVDAQAQEANAVAGAEQPVEFLPEPGSAYLSMLRQALTAELHFAAKIATPSQPQFDAIHRAGLQAIEAIADEYEELEHRREKPETWPDPNQSIAETLSAVIAREFPREVHERYQQEIAGRFRENRAADAAVVVNLIDNKVQLSSEQQQSLFRSLTEEWQPHWSTGSLVLLYAQYAALPEVQFLRPHLNEIQQRLWSYRPKLRRTTLPWQAHFGSSHLFGPVSLPEFPQPGKSAPSTVEDLGEAAQ